ncbi:MAG: hypothetical protein KBT67_00995 [bacterium]|nr:hypothetical protein [Candidatus Limimorpha caballi]
MRKLVFVLLMFLTLSINAQEISAVKFMGIPVDGKKSTMISKLKEKGFRYDYSNDCLYGEFNGNDVILFIHTNNNKVWRVAVVDDIVSDNETNIRIRYNKLLGQFENNSNYVEPLGCSNNKIGNDENISYEIIVNKKRYESYFVQIPTNEEIYELYSNKKYLNNWIDSEYTRESLDSLYYISKDEAEFNERIMNSFYIVHRLHAYCSNLVWFTIYESEGKYALIIYYENNENEANGEDL